MRIRTILSVVLFIICCCNTFAQDIATMSDMEFTSLLESLRKNGNDCYATTGNKYELKRIIHRFQNAIDTRVAAGRLSDSQKEALLSLDVNKLLGDYYYLDTDEKTSSFTEAENKFQECLQFAQSHPNYQNTYRYQYVIHQELAQLYYKQKRYVDAYREMTMAFKLANKYESPDSIDRYLDIQSQLALCKARVAETQKDFEDAISDIDVVISNYFETNSELYGEALRKKAKILMIEEESGGKSRKDEALTCYQEYFKLKKKDALTHFLGMNTEEREQYWMHIRPFITDCYRLENYDAAFLYDITLFAKGLLLQLDSAGGGRRGINTTWQMIQEKLQPDACAIEFIQYEKYGLQHMGALLLKKTGKPIFLKMAAPDSVMQYQIEVIDSKKTLKELLYSIRDQFCERNKNKLYSDSLGLNRFIWNQEIVQAIGKAHDIWFSPDGYMHQLAIEYLLPHQLSKVKCHRLTSTRQLLEARIGGARQRALIVGGVNYSSATAHGLQGNDSIAYRNIQSQGNISLRYLSSSRKEADSIFIIRQNALDTLFVGDNASESGFRQICSDFPIIHISTHGFFSAATVPLGTDLKPCVTDESLSESILVLAGAQHNLQDKTFNKELHDGLLSAKEISALDLSRTQLIVLCCCETGLGYVTADGVYGIQRGLKNAGVQAIICTLWDIDDTGSFLFMINFHHFLREGYTIPQAFYKARDEMKDYSDTDKKMFVFNHDTMMQEEVSLSYNFNTPYYRDAFILIDALE